MMKHHFLVNLAFCVVFFAAVAVCDEKKEDVSLEEKIVEAVENDAECLDLRRKIRSLELENYRSALEMYEIERELQLNEDRVKLTEELLKHAERVHEGVLKWAEYVETHEMYKLCKKDRFHEFVVHPLPDGLVAPITGASVKEPAGMSTDWLLIIDGKVSGEKRKHLGGKLGCLHGMTLFYRKLLSTKTTVYLLLLERRDGPQGYYDVPFATELDIVPHKTGLCEVLFDSKLWYSQKFTVALLLPPKMNDMNYVETVNTADKGATSADGAATKAKPGDLLMSLSVEKAEEIVVFARNKSSETLLTTREGMTDVDTYNKSSETLQITPEDMTEVDAHKSFGFSLFGEVVRKKVNEE